MFDYDLGDCGLCEEELDVWGVEEDISCVVGAWGDV